MNKECEREWAFVRDKHNKKIFHLIGKWQWVNNNDCEDKWKDILISDKVLMDKYGDTKVTPVVDEEVHLSESEKKVLSYPPKFTVFDKIDMSKVECSIEIMLDKLR